MPSFQDSAVLVILALLLFGPKKLPVLARQLGKLMNDFRRASNEFRTQMDEELRISEQADRQKQIAAIEAAAPPAAAVADSTPASDSGDMHPPPTESTPDPSTWEADSPYAQETLVDSPTDSPTESPEPAPTPLPIATSGELSIMPPDTGLPVPNSSNGTSPAHEPELETETLHG
jgi:sec-independent protein translocase protein TatB